MDEIVVNKFFKRVEKTESCWNWIGAKSGKYGKLTIQKNVCEWSHRLSYKIHKGTIKEGMHIDHLCNNPICVNPDHLEAITQAENNQRAWNKNRKEACPKGHVFDQENTEKTNNARRCRKCHIEDSKKRYLKNKKH